MVRAISRREVLKYSVPAAAAAYALGTPKGVDVDDVLAPDFGQWDLPR